MLPHVTFKNYALDFYFYFGCAEFPRDNQVSLAVEHGCSALGLSSCGKWA